MNTFIIEYNDQGKTGTYIAQVVEAANEGEALRLLSRAYSNLQEAGEVAGELYVHDITMVR